MSLQVYQLRQQVDEALSDLNKAIDLSGGRGKVAEQAHTQRGIIWRVKGDDEKALEDFRKAGKLGNRFAQKQVKSKSYTTWSHYQDSNCIV